MHSGPELPVQQDNCITGAITIQVLGDIAIHRAESYPESLTGVSRQLLAVLVATRDNGVTPTDLAHAFWPMSQPPSPELAIRFAVKRLQERLPDGWVIETAPDQSLSLRAGSGCVDAWRLAELADPAIETSPPSAEELRHLARVPFPGEELAIPLLLQAADHIRQQQAAIYEAHPRSADSTGPFESMAEADAFLRMRMAGRLLVTGRSRQVRHRLTDRALASQTAYETHRIIGDKRNQAPLLSITSTFGGVRNELLDLRDQTERSVTSAAWRILVEHLSRRAVSAPQRIVVEDAHLVDADSLEIVEMLLRYHIPRPLRILVVGDAASTAPGWQNLQASVHALGIETLPLDHDSAAALQATPEHGPTFTGSFLDIGTAV